MKQPDLVAVVEAAYAIDRSDADWLRGLVDAAAPSLPKELGLCAYLFDASVRPIEVGSFLNVGSSIARDDVCASLAGVKADFVDRFWVAGPACATASEIPDYPKQRGLAGLDRRKGIHDWLAVCAHDIDGVGCFIGAPLREKYALGLRERTLWARISAHVTTSLRLRNRLKRHATLESAAAILTPKGKIENITRETEHARKALQSAAIVIAEARGSLRKGFPERAVARWRALVSAQWSLVDHFDRDGKRYLIAEANEPIPKGPESLTAREKQVLALAAHGRENKIIAYELGLSASTVRVHLARAARKFRTTSRSATVAAYVAITTGVDDLP